MDCYIIPKRRTLTSAGVGLCVSQLLLFYVFQRAEKKIFGALYFGLCPQRRASDFFFRSERKQKSRELVPAFSFCFFDP